LCVRCYNALMPESRRILVTGFEPFGNMGRNPSADVVRAIRQSDPAKQIVAEILPVEYRRAEERIDALLLEHRPAAWIGFGLSQRATAITLERVAVNLDDATIADNSGEVRRGQLIETGGEELYRSTLPLDLIARELGHRSIPYVFSDTAGRFVCNHVFYHTLKTMRLINSDAMAGFIHLPWPSDWEPAPAVSHNVTLLTAIESAQACVDVILLKLPRINILAT